MTARERYYSEERMSILYDALSGAMRGDPDAIMRAVDKAFLLGVDVGIQERMEDLRGRGQV